MLLFIFFCFLGLGIEGWGGIDGNSGYWMMGISKNNIFCPIKLKFNFHPYIKIEIRKKPNGQTPKNPLPTPLPNPSPLNLPATGRPLADNKRGQMGPQIGHQAVQ